MQFVITLLIRMLGAEAIEAKILTTLAKKSPQFAKILKGAKKLKDLHKGFKKIMNYIDPNYLLGELLKLPQNKIAQYLKFRKDDYMKILKDLKVDEKNLKGDLSSLKASFQESYDNYMNGVASNNGRNNTNNPRDVNNNQSWVKMSSSWIQRGLYNRIGNTNNGIMTIFIRSDKDKKKRIYGPYIYPLIPIEVWTAMIRAKGKNGSGAGTIFWRMWLRKWLHSYLRDHTYKKLQAKYGTLNSQTYKRLPNTSQISQLIREQQELVKKAQYGYYKTNIAKYASARNNQIANIANISNGKAPSIIDNPSYLEGRKILQQETYTKLTEPIRNTKSQLNGVQDQISNARKVLAKRRQAIKNYQKVKEIYRTAKQFINDPIGYVPKKANAMVKKDLRGRIRDEKKRRQQ